MVEVPQHSWFGAYDNFIRLRKLSYNDYSHRLFLLFLGLPEDFVDTGKPLSNQAYGFHIPNDEAAHTINWLNGPHAYTMMKAWEAKNDTIR